jgi:DNA-binding transcriptional LysR family regulator
MEWLNFRHLYSFWMVQISGGFKAASNTMNVSQSTVSEQVALLEEYFEKSLFQRNTRGLKLTETGHRLFQYAETIFEKSREINLLIKEQEDLAESDLTVGIIGGVSRNLVYRLLGDSIENGTIKRFEVFNGSLDELSEACLGYKIDFFISTIPPSGKDLSLLESHIIQKSPIVLTGKKAQIAKIRRERKKPINMDLYNFQFPFLEGDIVNKFASRHSVNFQHKLDTDDISLLRFFANSSQGGALMPEIGVMEDLNDKRLDKIVLKFVKPINFFAVFPKISAKRALVDQIIQQF